MFVQVITGRVADPGALARQWEVWEDTLRPAAPGFLGGVTGTTSDGRAVLLARFDDGASARANAGRPEQGAWWEETSKAFEGDVRFDESDDVAVVHGRPTPAARFVQLMRARCSDRSAFEQVERELGSAFAAHRPDLLCGLRLWPSDDLVVAVDWFSSLADARAGEQKEPPAELAEGFGRWMSLLSEHEWFDLAEPRHV